MGLGCSEKGFPNASACVFVGATGRVTTLTTVLAVPGKEGTINRIILLT
jgi:hypothetical protein